MLIIGDKVLCRLRNDFNGVEIIKIIDDHDDLYRLLPNGNIYVHWYQEGKPMYTKNGSYIGNLLKDCIRQPRILPDPGTE